MSLTTIPKTIAGQSFKLAKAPLDIALKAFGGPRSPAERLAETERDRADALREAAEVRRHEADRREARVAEAARKLEATAAETAERDRRNAERRKRARQGAAAKTATKKKQKVAKSVAKSAGANSKANNAAQLKKLKAKEKSIKAKEAAGATEREADRLAEEATAAKAARKNGSA